MFNFVSMFRNRFNNCIVLTLSCRMASAQQTSRLFFDLNYDTDETLAPVSVKTGCMVPAAAKPYPTREGTFYSFTGLYGGIGILEDNTVSVKMEIEDVGAVEPELLSSPWGGGMSYKIEECQFRIR